MSRDNVVGSMLLYQDSSLSARVPARLPSEARDKQYDYSVLLIPLKPC